MEASERTFEIHVLDGVDAKDSKENPPTEDLDDLAVMQVMTVYVRTGRFFFVGEPESIQQKNTWQTLELRIIHVGDTTGTTRVAMWENDVGGLTIEKSYKITDMTVHIYTQHHRNTN